MTHLNVAPWWYLTSYAPILVFLWSYSKCVWHWCYILHYMVINMELYRTWSKGVHILSFIRGDDLRCFQFPARQKLHIFYTVLLAGQQWTAFCQKIRLVSSVFTRSPIKKTESYALKSDRRKSSKTLGNVHCIWFRLWLSLYKDFIIPCRVRQEVQ